jgi:hypothetical protein
MKHFLYLNHQADFQFSVTSCRSEIVNFRTVQAFELHVNPS